MPFERLLGRTMLCLLLAALFVFGIQKPFDATAFVKGNQGLLSANNEEPLIHNNEFESVAEHTGKAHKARGLETQIVALKLKSNTVRGEPPMWAPARLAFARDYRGSMARIPTWEDDSAAMKFIQRCFVPNEQWEGYSAAHSQRFRATVQRALPYLSSLSRVLHLGDGQGYLPILLHNFLGVTNQVNLDFMPTTARYRDNSKACRQGDKAACRTDTCDYEQLTGSLASPWPADYIIKSTHADFDANSAWDLPNASFDVAFSLEVVEHLWAGPQNFFLNIARLLKPGGVFIVTTPNSNSFTTLQRTLDGKNPFSFSPFRKNYEGKPAPEHIKEYSVSELDGALTNSGFNITHAETMDPYGHPRGDQMDSVVAERLALDKIATGRRGEVHIIISRKVGCGTAATRPCYAAWKPLYDFEQLAPPVY